MASGHAYVQSSDPSSRPGALHVDAGGRQAWRYGPAIHASVTTGRAPGDKTMQDLKAQLLRGLWYVAFVGHDVRPGRLVHKTLVGDPSPTGPGPDGRGFSG